MWLGIMTFSHAAVIGVHANAEHPDIDEGTEPVHVV